MGLHWFIYNLAGVYSILDRFVYSLLVVLFVGTELPRIKSKKQPNSARSLYTTEYTNSEQTVVIFFKVGIIYISVREVHSFCRTLLRVRLQHDVRRLRLQLCVPSLQRRTGQIKSRIKKLREACTTISFFYISIEFCV